MSKQINVSLEDYIFKSLRDLNISEYNEELSNTQLIRIILKAAIRLPKSELLALIGKPARDED